MLEVCWKPRSPYISVWQQMQDFTRSRGPETKDQIWLLEHNPVYTLGRAGKREHIIDSGEIEVIQCDRGGQVTYHGPGQLVAYCLIDLRRYHLFVKEYVELLENVLIALLGNFGIKGQRLPGAPGVYVPTPYQHNTDASRMRLAKIAALGIKVTNGCTYHGLALNVDMDLTPFEGINPCGYEHMPTTDLNTCGVALTIKEAGDMLAQHLKSAIISYKQKKLSYGGAQ